MVISYDVLRHESLPCLTSGAESEHHESIAVLEASRSVVSNFRVPAVCTFLLMPQEDALEKVVGL